MQSSFVPCGEKQLSQNSCIFQHVKTEPASLWLENCRIALNALCACNEFDVPQYGWKEFTADFMWKLICVTSPLFRSSTYLMCVRLPIYLMQAVKVVASSTSMKRKAIYLLALEKFGNQASKEEDWRFVRTAKNPQTVGWYGITERDGYVLYHSWSSYVCGMESLFLTDFPNLLKMCILSRLDNLFPFRA